MHLYCLSMTLDDTIPPILQDKSSWFFSNELPKAEVIIATTKELVGSNSHFWKYSKAAQYWLGQRVGMKSISLDNANKIHDMSAKQHKIESKVGSKSNKAAGKRHKAKELSLTMYYIMYTVDISFIISVSFDSYVFNTNNSTTLCLEMCPGWKVVKRLYITLSKATTPLLT